MNTCPRLSWCAVATAAALAVTTSCGPSVEDGDRVVLVTYDSFPTADSPLNEALQQFEADSGVSVEILIAGDTGEMVSKAALTAGNPEGDVMWGVDSTFLGRALDEKIFEPLGAIDVGSADSQLAGEPAPTTVVPVNYGDVCVNYDIADLTRRGLDAPSTLSDLLDPDYRSLLVVQDPALSSVGLAFLFATIAEFGPTGWQSYWRQLIDNDVLIAGGWTESYYGDYSRHGGNRPLVVSYGSSPPVEVLLSEPPPAATPTGVAAQTCFRNVEYAGVLRGTSRPDEARQLVEFLRSAAFQRELPLTLFVYPADGAVDLPAAFTDHITQPDRPYRLDPGQIDAERANWIDEWTNIVMG